MQLAMSLLAQYGLLFVFLNVLVQQAGVPVPSYPTLILTGAMAGQQHSQLGLLLVATVASLCADTAWFYAGQRYGSRMVRTICRISLSPDTCIRQTENIYLRWGPKTLIVAKLLPGLGSVATTLAGAMRTPLPAFLIFDALGAMLWSGIAISLGYLFRDAVSDVLNVLTALGRIGLLLVTIALALFILGKWWRRRMLIMQLRMARVSVDELRELLDGAQPPIVLDVRSTIAQADGRIPGALSVQMDAPLAPVADLPRNTEIIVYCSCPNEISAAKIAKALMMSGYSRVRPLAGGIDAWRDAGFEVDGGQA